MIVAGQLASAFDLTIGDNALQDGDQLAVITARAGFMSASASMTIVDDDIAPVILADPTNLTVTVGGTATFCVAAKGNAPMNYFWRRNGNPIAGASGNCCTTTNVQLADNVSQFSCLVSNALGVTNSRIASLTVIPAGSDFITFDDLPGVENPVPAGYHAFTWNNFYYLNAFTGTGNPSGYLAGMLSLSNVAYNAYGTNAYLASAAPFNLVLGYLTAAWYDNLQLQVLGSSAGILLYSNTWILSATNPTLVSFNYAGVTRVDFISSGGTQHPGYAGSGTHFAMENVSLTTGSVILPWRFISTSLINRVFNTVLTGPAGSNFVIQISSNLMNGWQPFLTSTIPAGGSMLIIDPSATNQAQRFYRAASPAGASPLSGTGNP
jgi:hypothetical protein